MTPVSYHVSIKPMEDPNKPPDAEIIAESPADEVPERLTEHLPLWVWPTATLVFLLAFFGAGMAGYQYYVSSHERDPQLQSLQQQVKGLAAQLDETHAQVGALQGQVAQFNQTLQALAQALQRSAGPGPQGTALTQPSTAGQPSLGAADAPVLIVEFADFQCPFCRRFEQESFERLKTDYIDTGVVRFVFRDFPLTQIHPHAELAAEAAACADEQGEFWPMHDMLFRNQPEWAGGSAAAARRSFRQYAQALGLKLAQFGACLSDRRYSQSIKQDLQAGSRLGVRGTPTFFINGRPLVGAQPYATFKSAIESALASR